MDDRKMQFRIVLAFLSLAMVIACSSRSDYSGVYQTEESAGEMVSNLELKNNGEGYWRVGDSEEVFIWYLKRNQIRLNTKKGAVFVADINGDVLEITMSGGKKLTFRRIK